MAKYERSFTGNFSEVLRVCESAALSSLSASAEDSSNYRSGNMSVAVRVYERYSAFGKNRVSLNVTLVGEGDRMFLSAITSGGSQAVFFKLNTIGEESFLQTLANQIEAYISRGR